MKMQGKRVKAALEALVQEKNLPYVDFSISKGHEELYRYYTAKDGNATGMERLRLYSCTKVCTAACALKLVEEGKLDLDDPVSKYLPAYAEAFKLDENGQPIPVKTPMTIRHLLTMTGGLTYDMDTPPLLELKKLPEEEVSTEQFISTFIKTPLIFEPGSRYNYSLCHDTLGGVIEAITGKRLSQYMEETFFKPLEIGDLAFHSQDKGLANLYAFTPINTVVQIDAYGVTKIPKHYDCGGGGLIGQISEYAKFGRMLASGGVTAKGERLIQEETLALMRSEQLSKMMEDNNFSCAIGSDYSYALGVRTRLKATEWGLPVEEYGWDGAAGSFLLIDPVHQISVTVGMHIMNWGKILAGEHLKLVEAAYADMEEAGLL